MTQSAHSCFSGRSVAAYGCQGQSIFQSGIFECIQDVNSLVQNTVEDGIIQRMASSNWFCPTARLPQTAFWRSSDFIALSCPEGIQNRFSVPHSPSLVCIAGLHPCATAHASFFPSLLTRNAHSASFFEMHNDKPRRRPFLLQNWGFVD